MGKYTGYGSLTLSLKKQAEGDNESDAMSKLIKELNNYGVDLNDIELFIKGKKVKLSDFDLNWDDIEED